MVCTLALTSEALSAASEKADTASPPCFTSTMPIALLVELLRYNINDRTVFDAGAHILIERTILDPRNGSNVEAAVAAGAIPIFVSALRKHAASVAMCECTINVLANLTISDATQELAIAAGATPLLVNALRTHMAVENLCYVGCAAISHILLYLKRKGGIRKEPSISIFPLLVEVFQTHASSSFVFCPVIVALGLFMSNEAGHEAGISAFVAAGALPLTVTALRTHAGLEPVCRDGISVFSKIACSEFGGNALVKAGVVPVLVRALQQHKHLASVCSVACSTISNMSLLSPTNRALVAAAGAIPLVIAALRAHGADLNLTTFASSALCNMSLRNTSNRDATIGAGAVPVLVRAFALHRDDCTSRALEMLGFDEKGARRA